MTSSIERPNISNNFLKKIAAYAALAKNHFYVPLFDEKNSQEYTFRRVKEKRADLFALEHLVKQGLINPILDFVYYLTSQRFEDWTSLMLLHLPGMPFTINIGMIDEHPSHIERALYCLGFLAAHGVDINKALRDYEAHGTCVDGENLKLMVDYLKPQKDLY